MDSNTRPQTEKRTEKKPFNPNCFTEEEFAVEIADIDKFLDDQLHINLSSHGNLEPWLDIMKIAMQLSDEFGSVRPIEIYIALLEAGRTYEKFEGQNVLRNDCVMYMGMLLPYNLFTAKPNGEGRIDDYTLFTPNKDHRYMYFMVRVKELVSEEFRVANSTVSHEYRAFKVVE